MKLLVNKFINAWRGMRILVKDKSVLIQIVIMCMVIAVCAYLSITVVEWCIILLCCALVIVSESVNTMIEYLCDIVQPEYDERIKKIKDGSAGFVLIASIFALIIGCIILKGYLW